MKKTTFFCFFCFLFLFNTVFTFAFFNVLDVPESSSIRKNIMETWLTAPISELKTKSPEVHYSSLGQIFQVRTEYIADKIAVVVVPRQIDYSFPFGTPGSWALLKNPATGENESVRFYFQANNEIYIQFRQGNPKNLVDFVMFDSYAVLGAPVILPFEQTLTVSFAQTVEITKPFLPWNYTKIDPRLYYYNLFMIAQIRESLNHFEYVADAAYNERGEPVYINSEKPRVDPEYKMGISSYGFVKWIIDGLVEPITGGLTKIAPLKNITVQNPGLWEQTYTEQENTFFALDWCRNLAVAAVSVSADAGAKRTNQTDVNSDFFAALITPQGIKNEAGYVKNSGYVANMIKPLLYVSAALYPERFYLAAVKTTQKDNPDIIKFSHTAAIFPYFDSSQKLRIVVFENGTEVNFEDFIAQYQNSFIHLSQIVASDRFFPLIK